MRCSGIGVRQAALDGTALIVCLVLQNQESSKFRRNLNLLWPFGGTGIRARLKSESQRDVSSILTRATNGAFSVVVTLQIVALSSPVRIRNSSRMCISY